MNAKMSKVLCLIYKLRKTCCTKYTCPLVYDFHISLIYFEKRNTIFFQDGEKQIVGKSVFQTQQIAVDQNVSCNRCCFLINVVYNSLSVKICFHVFFTFIDWFVVLHSFSHGCLLCKCCCITVEDIDIDSVN